MGKTTDEKIKEAYEKGYKDGFSDCKISTKVILTEMFSKKGKD